MPGKSAEHAPQVAQSTTAVQIVPGVPHVNVYNLAPVDSGISPAQIISIVAIIVAIATSVGNALWQSFLQQRQLKQSMFEKRLNVYLRSREFLSAMAQAPQPQMPQLQQLLRDTNSAEWLFKPAIKDFIEKQVYVKGERLRELNSLYTTHNNTLPEAQLDEMHELETWLVNVAPVRAQELFRPYLKLY